MYVHTPMLYIAMQVKTREEAKFIKLCRGLNPELSVEFVYPRRILSIRRRGKSRQTEVPIFPGYVFIHTEKLDPIEYWKIRKVPGFIRFLKSNNNIQPLEGKDLELFLHFLQHGEIVRKSKAVFDENKRIVILEGPLKGLEGRIVKVDRRKSRVKVRLDLQGEQFLIDLGVEFIGEAGNANS